MQHLYENVSYIQYFNTICSLFIRQFYLTLCFFYVIHCEWCSINSLWAICMPCAYTAVNILLHSLNSTKKNKTSAHFIRARLKPLTNRTPDSHLFFFRASHITWKINLSSFVICTRNTFPFP